MLQATKWQSEQSYVNLSIQPELIGLKTMKSTEHLNEVHTQTHRPTYTFPEIGNLVLDTKAN